MFQKAFLKATGLAGLLFLHTVQPAHASAVAYIDEAEKKFVVSSHFYFWGSKMTAEIVKRAVAEIDRMWNEPKVIYLRKGQEYPITFKFTYELAQPYKPIKLDLTQMINSVDNTYVHHPYTSALDGNGDFAKTSMFYLAPRPDMNAIQVEQSDPKYDNRSNYFCGGQTGKFLVTDDLGNSTTAAHEYGHGLGLGHLAGSLCKKEDGPSIMCARGSVTLPKFQYDPKAVAGKKGGTLNPYFRKVRVEDILALELERIPVNGAGLKVVGPHLKAKCAKNKL